MSNRDPRKDYELVEAINNGEENAFEALYYRYRDWIVRLAYRFTGNENDALDVLQETFAYLLKKTPNLRLTARMTTFLYPVVKHLSLSLLRKEKRYVSDDKILESIKAPESTPTSLEDLSLLLKALPSHQKEVVLMRFVDDMDLKEIAEALNIPLGTVKSRLHNALNLLRNDPRTKKYLLGNDY